MHEPKVSALLLSDHDLSALNGMTSRHISSCDFLRLSNKPASLLSNGAKGKSNQENEDCEGIITSYSCETHLCSS